MSAGDHLGIEHEPPRRAVGGARGVGGAHREPVDAGAVERRHVGRRREIGGEHAFERIGEGDGLDRQRSEIDGAFEPAARLGGGNHFEELLLARRIAHRGEEFVGGVGRRRAFAAHGSGLTATEAPAG